MTRTGWALFAVLAMIPLISVISAGCGSKASSETGTASSTHTAGSGTGTTSSTGTTKKKLSARDKAVKFAECVRAHGVSDFPDPDAKNRFQVRATVTRAVWTKAVNACKALQPPGTLSGKRTPKEQSASLRFAQCVRDHGVKDFPDPINGELMEISKIPSTSKPGGMTILNAAAQKCRTITGFAAGG